MVKLWHRGRVKETPAQFFLYCCSFFIIFFFYLLCLAVLNCLFYLFLILSVNFVSDVLLAPLFPFVLLCFSFPLYFCARHILSSFLFLLSPSLPLWDVNRYEAL